MIKQYSLSITLPLVLMTTFIILMVIDLTYSTFQRNQEIFAAALSDAKRTAAHLTRMAERSESNDLLYDDIAQTSTDPRIMLIAVINPERRIIHATDYTLEGQSTTLLSSYLHSDLFTQATLQKTAIIKTDYDNNKLSIIMGYTDRKDSNTRYIRPVNQGLIFLHYDLNRDISHAFISSLQKRTITLFTSIFAAFLLSLFFRKYLINPLKALKRSALAVTRGDYQAFEIINGPNETTTVFKAFDEMAEKLSANLQQLRLQNSHTNAILDNIVDGIVTINHQGIILSFNRSAETIFAYTAQEVIGQNVKILMPEPFYSNHDKYLERYRLTQERSIIGLGREVEGRRKDGSIFPLELAVTELPQEQEKIFVGILRDITEKKKIDKMKSEFISTVSHELRTPLTAIRGTTDLIMSGITGTISDKTLSLLEISKRNSERLLHLVNDILDVEKLLAGKMDFNIQQHDIVALSKDSLEMNKAYAEKHQTILVYSGEESNILVNLDARRVEQVLANFISNACKFSPADSTVELNVSCHHGWVRVAVIDMGSGIAKEFRDRIFEKFSQSDSSDSRHYEGTGLGLAISKEIILRMGGHIGFDSVLGQGSTFYFEFPTL